MCVCVCVCMCEYERNVKEGLGVLCTCVSVRVVSLELLLIGMFNVKGYVTPVVSSSVTCKCFLKR